MVHYLAEKRFIPWDKSDGIRKGWIEIIRSNDKAKYTSCLDFLRFRLHEVSTDLQALYLGGIEWMEGRRDIHVGESGTLYRFMRTKAWQEGRDARFVKTGSLRKRKIYGKPDVLEMSPQERLALDGGTSQWESAAYICGLSKKIENPPEKLRLTYECVDRWKKLRGKKKWHFRFDQTILRQAIAYLRQLHLDERSFVPRHSEDYCFARAFEYMTREEGEERWPQLRHHESNRLEEMEIELRNALAGKPIKSKDHRVLAANAMRAIIEKKPLDIRHPEASRKSWPELINFLFQSKFFESGEALEPA